MNPESEPVTPIVFWRELWPEIFGLIAAVIVLLISLVFDLADKNPDLFQRAGTVTLFVVVVLQFKSLSDLNKKHINNALRAKGVLEGKIQNVSVTRTNLSWLVLIVAIYGAAISAFGDKFVVALIKLLCV